MYLSILGGEWASVRALVLEYSREAGRRSAARGPVWQCAHHDSEQEAASKTRSPSIQSAGMALRCNRKMDVPFRERKRRHAQMFPSSHKTLFVTTCNVPERHAWYSLSRGPRLHPAAVPLRAHTVPCHSAPKQTNVVDVLDLGSSMTTPTGISDSLSVHDIAFREWST